MNQKSVKGMVDIYDKCRKRKNSFIGKYEVKAILSYLNDRPQSNCVHEQVANAD